MSEVTGIALLVSTVILAFSISWLPIIYLSIRSKESLLSKCAFAVVQVAVVIAIVNLMLAPVYGVFIAFLWPIGLTTIGFVLERAQIGALLVPFVWWGLLGLVASGAVILNFKKELRRFTIVLTAFSGLAVGLIGANLAMQKQMASAARDAGAQCLATANIWRAANVALSGSFSGYYARAYFDDHYHYWSFRKKAFVANWSPTHPAHTIECAGRGLTKRNL